MLYYVIALIGLICVQSVHCYGRLDTTRQPFVQPTTNQPTTDTIIENVISTTNKPVVMETETNFPERTHEPDDLRQTVTPAPVILGPDTRVPAAGAAKDFVRGCYYHNWAQNRDERGKYTPENYEVGLCTHIYYAYVIMNDDFMLQKLEQNDEENYKKINDYKTELNDLKTLLSFGGYKFVNQNKELLTKMMSSPMNRRRFIDSALDYVKKYKFDGIDLHISYIDPLNKWNFNDLIKELTDTFHSNKLLVTVAVSGIQKTIEDVYDVPTLAKAVDYINILSYNFHSWAWEKVTGHNSPFLDRNGDKLSVKTAAEIWSSKGMPKVKTLIGFPTYGLSWTLSDANKFDVGASATEGKPGPHTAEKGVLSYYEIEDMLAAGGKRYVDDIQKVPYLVKDDQWISYDDEQSYQTKLDWLIKGAYGGAFVESLDMDDFSGYSSKGVKYPLTKTIKKAFFST